MGDSVASCEFMPMLYATIDSTTSCTVPEKFVLLVFIRMKVVLDAANRMVLLISLKMK
jgi:hypothetical protein